MNGMTCLNQYKSELANCRRLSEKELAELFPKAKSGDKNARARIVESNLKLVYSLASPHFNKCAEPIDLIQIGNAALNEAIDHFDATKGFKFNTYAGRAIQNALLRYLKAGSKFAKELSESCFTNDDAEDFDFFDRSDDRYLSPEDEYIAKETAVRIKKSMKLLSEKEREVFMRRNGLFEFDREESFSEIAAEMDMTKEGARIINLRAISKIRNFLGE